MATEVFLLSKIANGIKTSGATVTDQGSGVCDYTVASGTSGSATATWGTSHTPQHTHTSRVIQIDNSGSYINTGNYDVYYGVYFSTDGGSTFTLIESNALSTFAAMSLPQGILTQSVSTSLDLSNIVVKIIVYAESRASDNAEFQAQLSIIGTYSTATTYNASLTAGLNLAATRKSTVGKKITAALTAALTLAKSNRFLKGLAAAVTGSAAVAKAWALVLSVVSSLSPSFKRGVAQTITASLNLTELMVRRLGKILAPGLACTVSVLRGLKMALSSALTGAVTLTRGAGSSKTLLATTTVTANARRGIGRMFTASTSLATGLVRQIRPIIVTVLYANPGFALRHLRILSASCTAAMAMVRTPAQVLMTSMNLAATFGVNLGKIILIGLSPTVRLTKGMARSLTVGISCIRKMARGFKATLPVVSSLSPSVSPAKLAIRALTASLTVSGGILKALGKGLTASLSVVASLLSAARLARVLVASSTLGAVVVKGFAKAFTRTLTASPFLVRAFGLTRTVTLTLTPTRAWALLVTLQAKVNLGLSILGRRFVPVLLATSSTALASLAAARGKTLQVVLSLSTTLRRALAVVLPVAITNAMARIGRGLSSTFTASVSSVPLLAKANRFARAMTATLASSATLAAPRLLLRSITATLAATPGLLRSITKTLSAGLTATASRLAAYARTLTASVTGTPVLARTLALGRVLTASATSSASLALLKARTVALSASVAVAGGMAKAVSKTLAFALSLAPRLTRAWGMRFTAGIGLSASLLKPFSPRNLVDAARRVLAPLRRRVWRP